MNCKIVMIGILFFASFVFQSANASMIAAKDSMSVLHVTSAYDSLVVYLDGKIIGKTPLDSLPVETGSHELVVRSPYWPSWTQSNYTTSFFAAAGKAYRFTAKFSRNVLINSIPYGAEIFENDKLIGTTPLYVFQKENRQIRVEKEGYDSFTLDLGRSDKLSYVLRLIPKKEWLLENKIRAEKKKSKITQRRRLLAASIGFAAAAGLSTIHFRSRGNEEFAAYQKTAIPSQMDRYFERAQYNDRLASASYALFELGFVMTGYFFLTSRP
ncbi:MAG: PEGA domain-containing protein [Calditrichaeota bacterium]|nr:PEGA domain-containing protein [Calditrichota bacterium]